VSGPINLRPANDDDKDRHAFVVRYTQHEYEWIQASAGIAPPDRIPWSERCAWIDAAVKEATAHGVLVHFIDLTAQQVIDFLTLTETRYEDAADLGAQLAIMIGINRMKRGEIT
jgi:hypothetical protein